MKFEATYHLNTCMQTKHKYKIMSKNKDLKIETKE